MLKSECLLLCARRPKLYMQRPLLLTKWLVQHGRLVVHVSGRVCHFPANNICRMTSCDTYRALFANDFSSVLVHGLVIHILGSSGVPW